MCGGAHKSGLASSHGTIGGAVVRKQTRRLTPDEQQQLNMRDTLRTLKSRCASQERQIKRLLSDNPQIEAEREILRLEQRCEDLTRLCLLAEDECLQLRKQLHLQEVA
jgi:hypothetical protein